MKVLDTKWSRTLNIPVMGDESLADAKLSKHVDHRLHRSVVGDRVRSKVDESSEADRRRVPRVRGHEPRVGRGHEQHL